MAVVTGYGLFYTIMYYPSYGLAAGLAVVLGTVVARRLAAPHGPAQSPRWTIAGLVLGLLTGSVAGLAVELIPGPQTGLIIGIMVTSAVGVVFGIDAVPNLTTVRSPAWVLARDRTTFVILATAMALIVTVILTLLISNELRATTILGALIYGLASGITVATGRAAWARYFTRRCWLALTGRAPWAFIAFLADAHRQRGVLRQNGATYQFRHLDLQRRLAADR